MHSHKKGKTFTIALHCAYSDHQELFVAYTPNEWSELGLQDSEMVFAGSGEDVAGENCSLHAVRSFEKKWLSAPVLLANNLPLTGRLIVP